MRAFLDESYQAPWGGQKKDFDEKYPAQQVVHPLARQLRNSQWKIQNHFFDEQTQEDKKIRYHHQNFTVGGKDILENLFFC